MSFFGVAYTTTPVVSVERTVKNAGDVFGYENIAVDGTFVRSTSLGTAVDAMKVKELGAEPVDNLLDLWLQKFPDAGWKKRFMREHKVVSTGAGYSVVRDVPGLTAVPLAVCGPDAEEHTDQFYADLFAVRGDAVRERRKRNEEKQVNEGKRYALEQFFSDSDVIDKFRIPAVMLQLMRRKAVSDACATAQATQRWLRREGHEGVIVHPGEYVKRAKHAKSLLNGAAARIPDVMIQVPAKIVGANIYIEARTDYVRGDADVVFTVIAPSHLATVATGVFKLANLLGVFEVVHLFAEAMAILNIQIHSPRYENMYPVVPCVAMQGIKPSDHAGVAIPRSVAERVIPVEVEGIGVVASAVRLSGTQAVMCGHVSDALIPGKFTLCGQPAVKVSNAGLDVVTVEHAPVEFLSSAFVTRDPVIGESVRLCYAVPSGRLEVTSVGRVLSSKAQTIVTTVFPEAREGCSGGVVYAETDDAVLGVYHGASEIRALVCRVDEFSVVRPEVLPCDPADVVVEGDFGVGATVYGAMCGRGLDGRIKTVAGAIESVLLAGRIPAVGTVFGRKAVLPVDVGLWPVVMKEKTLINLTKCGGRGLAQYDVDTPGDTPLLVRQAVVGERVFMVDLDAARQVLVSKLTTVIGRTADGIQVKKIVGYTPSTGAVVLAYDDAAVLGGVAGIVESCKGEVLRVVDYPALALDEAVSSILTRELLWRPQLWSVDVTSVLTASAEYGETLIAISETPVPVSRDMRCVDRGTSMEVGPSDMGRPPGEENESDCSASLFSGDEQDDCLSVVEEEETMAEVMHQIRNKLFTVFQQHGFKMSTRQACRVLIAAAYLEKEISLDVAKDMLMSNEFGTRPQSWCDLHASTFLSGEGSKVRSRSNSRH